MLICFLVTIFFDVDVVLAVVFIVLVLYGVAVVFDDVKGLEKDVVVNMVLEAVVVVEDVVVFILLLLRLLSAVIFFIRQKPKNKITSIDRTIITKSTIMLNVCERSYRQWFKNRLKNINKSTKPTIQSIINIIDLIKSQTPFYLALFL